MLGGLLPLQGGADGAQVVHEPAAAVLGQQRQVLGPQREDHLVLVAVMMLVGMRGIDGGVFLRCPGRVEPFSESQQKLIGRTAINLLADLSACPVENWSPIQLKAAADNLRFDAAKGLLLGLAARGGEVGVGAAQVGEARVTGARAGAVGQVRAGGAGGGRMRAGLGEHLEVNRPPFRRDAPVRHAE